MRGRLSAVYIKIKTKRVRENLRKLISVKCNTRVVQTSLIIYIVIKIRLFRCASVVVSNNRQSYRNHGYLLIDNSYHKFTTMHYLYIYHVRDYNVIPGGFFPQKLYTKHYDIRFSAFPKRTYTLLFIHKIRRYDE